MKTIQYYLLLLLVAIGIQVQAQNNKVISKDTSITFKVFGACVQCKARIEGVV